MVSFINSSLVKFLRPILSLSHLSFLTPLTCGDESMPLSFPTSNLFSRHEQNV
jgi:hypothetical protein